MKKQTPQKSNNRPYELWWYIMILSNQNDFNLVWCTHSCLTTNRSNSKTHVQWKQRSYSQPPSSSMLHYSHKCSFIIINVIKTTNNAKVFICAINNQPLAFNLYIFEITSKLRGLSRWPDKVLHECMICSKILMNKFKYFTSKTKNGGLLWNHLLSMLSELRVSFKLNGFSLFFSF